jgi:hypothetical protein
MKALFVINATFNPGQIVAAKGVYDLKPENPEFAWLSYLGALW